MSSFSKLISHPDRRLSKHLAEVDKISSLAFRSKFIDESLVSEVDLEFFRKLLVYFHDFGKSTAFFQHKIIKAAQNENPTLEGLHFSYVDDFLRKYKKSELEEAMANNPKLGSHANIGAFVQQANLSESSFIRRAVLLEVVKRHHGDLQNFDRDEFMLDDFTVEVLKEQWEKADKKDYRLIIDLLAFSLPEDVDGLLESYGSARFVRKLSRELPADDLQPYILTLLLFSVLLAADKGDMMLREKEGIGSVERFKANLIQNYKDLKFGDGKAGSINLLREKAYKTVEQTITSNLNAPFYSITLPTGLGKTLTAYNAAIQLQNLLADNYKRGGYAVVPRIIYCLPFTSVIDQNALVLEEIFEKNGIQGGFLARHHYLSDWPNQKEYNNELSDSEKEYFTEGWEYPFTITTFVQLLETVFSNRNRKLRKFHNLANSIVILDEVQNIPAKYFESVEAMFKSLFDYFNTRFLFVTATQPFLISNDRVVELTDPEFVQTKVFFKSMDRISLDLSLWWEGELTLEDLIPKFQEAIDFYPQKSFLIILNKVKESQRVFLELEKRNPEAEMVYLSAAILPVLREEKIDIIKNPPKNKQLIVVSTQVVEAGVDIDLDIVYRDLAPLDSINQSAGRCNRNGIKGKGEVRLFASHKGASIYDKELVHITENVLKRHTQNSGSNLIPERDFYFLNEDYAKAVRSKIADQNAYSEIIDWMKNMQFKTVAESFKLISKQENRYSVFIDFSEQSSKVWSDYVSIMEKTDDRWELKKELRKLRPRLLKYVVQFPERALPYELRTDEKSIIYLGPKEYEQYYCLNTGYGVYEEPSDHEAVVVNT